MNRTNNAQQKNTHVSGSFEVNLSIQIGVHVCDEFELVQGWRNDGSDGYDADRYLCMSFGIDVYGDAEGDWTTGDGFVKEVERLVDVDGWERLGFVDVDLVYILDCCRENTSEKMRDSGDETYLRWHYPRLPLHRQRYHAL